MSLSISNNTCSKCNVRLPKNRPKITCWHCGVVKHYRCQGLSKTDTYRILATPNLGWMCNECITDILPINACSKRPTKDPQICPKFKASCHSCKRMCYTKNNMQTCNWCDQLCHKSCINNELGCQLCCE